MTYYRRGNHSKKNYGAERAAQHIREAEEFSAEVGGTDKDVKSYFFSIDAEKREKILKLYGEKFGIDKENYARETWLAWASGRRKMSGVVAQRLFGLLPDYMPVATKLQMVESLWKHSSPSSHHELKMDSRCDVREVLNQVKMHFHDKLKHEIPENFIRRFDWLAGSDANVKQQLLNYFRSLELGVIDVGLEPKLEMLSKHLRDNNNVFISGSHTISIGNHRLVLNFDNSEAIAEKKRAEEIIKKLEREKKQAKFNAKVNEFLKTLLYIVAAIIGAIIIVFIISQT